MGEDAGTTDGTRDESTPDGTRDESAPDGQASSIQADGGPTRSALDEAGYDVADPEAQEFGLRGWGLVLALVVALLVIPWTIIALPEARALLETLPLGWRDAYLVLPFIPAVLLGALGVWTALANRRE